LCFFKNRRSEQNFSFYCFHPEDHTKWREEFWVFGAFAVPQCTRR
jgi:hypothetical protein